MGTSFSWQHNGSSYAVLGGLRDRAWAPHGGGLKHKGLIILRSQRVKNLQIIERDPIVIFFI